MEAKFAILDFGSQVTQLIARRLRELEVYSELFPYDVDIQKIRDFKPTGIILSGGPSSVSDASSPKRSVKELAAVAPIFGICYGMQLIADEYGGEVAPAKEKEYGLNEVQWQDFFSNRLGAKLKDQKQKVWMSHGDIITKCPDGFKVIATSQSKHPAALMSDGVWAVQFHPEVSHTEFGTDILAAFVFEHCKAEKTWDSGHILAHIESELKNKVAAKDHILCGLSGGVDSTVVAYLLTKIFGKERVHCIFVNNGLLRKHEFEEVLQNYQQFDLNVKGVDATKEFYSELAGIEDPEKKRKTIGRVFIEVFERAAKPLNVQWLAQGTLYPDVIESVNLRGSSVTIKSHHNVGGLPEKMNLKLLEPLRELFKDEVRALGESLGLPHGSLWRHPFPGPGLGVRILGDITPEKVSLLQEADHIFIRELKKHNLYEEIWQAYVALLPVKAVGVQGDNRTYANAVVLRAVTSKDGMTADWYPFAPDFLRHVSNCITNEVSGVNRVVYDVTSKPPATIEWE